MSKNKMKSNKGLMKRISLTAKKKIKFFGSGKRHFLRKKNKNKKRILKKGKYMNNSTFNVIKKMLI